jgi:predicted porin
MKKTIIAASIAAVMSAPAMAELTVYGKVHMGVGQSTENALFTGHGETGTDTDGTDDSIGSTTTTIDTWVANYNAKNDNKQVVDQASRFGFKASEDLGDGMKVFGTLEFQTSVADGSSDGGIQDRDSYVGLSGDFGKVVVGNMAAPTKAMLYKLGNIHDADANNGYDAAAAFESKGDRVANVVAYANSFNGVNLTAATVVGANDYTSATTMGLDYTINGLTIGGAVKNTDSANGEDITLVGAKYTMGDLTVGIVNEKTDGQTNLFGVASAIVAAEGESDVNMISASYKMGNNVLAASWSKADAKIVDATNDAGDYQGTLTAETFNVSLSHSLSKSASIYVAHTTQDISGTLDASSGSSDPSVASGGRDMTSVGISYSF